MHFSASPDLHNIAATERLVILRRVLAFLLGFLIDHPFAPYTTSQYGQTTKNSFMVV